MTAEEIQLEIDDITTAISHLLKGGQNYSLMTMAGGGTQRSVTMVDYNKLIERKRELQCLLDSIDGTRAVRIRAGW